MGVKTKRGGNWCTGSLWYLLNNPLYAGITRFTAGGMTKDFNSTKIQKYKGKHEAIIDIELFKKAQEKNKKHNETWFKWKRPAVKHEYWLRGLLKCSNCGKNLIMIQRKSGNKTKPFFQCNGYNKKSCNESHSILQEKLEDALLKQIKQIYIKKLDINIVESDNSDDTISILNKTIDKFNLRLERIKLAYMDGIDTLEEYKEKKKTIQQEIIRINKQIDSYNSQNVLKEKKDNIYNLCDSAYKTLSDKKVSNDIKVRIANQLFDKIIYNKKENTLYVYFKKN